MSDEPGCLGKLRVRSRPSEAVLANYGRWEAPDEAAARDAYFKSHAHHGVLEVKCHIKELKEFGQGVHMYFILLKHIAVLFVVLAFVPGILLVVFNSLGGWYDTADLERTMLGNYGLLSYNGAGSELNLTTSGISSRSVSQEGSVTALFASTWNQLPAKVGGMNKRSLLVAMSVLDLVGVVTFFGFAMFMIYHVRRTADDSDASAATLKDYSVRVEGLPPDTSAIALKEYLIKAAGEGVEVADMELCRCVDNLVALVVERGNLVQQHELALAKVQRTAEIRPRVSESLLVELLYHRYLLEDLTEATKKEQTATKTHEVVTAFVTLSSCEGRQRMLRALPRSLMKQWRMKPESKFNNGGIGLSRIKPVALDVSPAPEPSDIKYENLEYTRGERIARSIATNAAKYLVLLVGFLLVSLAPALRMGIAAKGSGPPKTQCSAACSYTDGAGNYVLNNANRELYKQCDPVYGNGVLPNKLDCEDTTICYECFCRAALNAGMYGEVSYCSRFSSVLGTYTLAQALAVLGVVLTNTLIEYAITWLVRQEKHHTRTREAVGITRSLFLTTLFNTAFGNLVANMYLPGPAGLISGSFLAGYIFTGAFADTTPNWYHDVCRPITISLFLTTVIVHLKIAFRWWWRRRCLATRYTCLTQWQLEETYEGHEFELALKYGQHLYVIYVVMVYSSGVPLMYILAAIHFSTCYWSEKYELLRLCKRPLTYSRDLAFYFSSSLPFAALWHLAFGIWFFGLYGMPKSPLIAKAFRRSLESSVKAFKGLMPVASSLTPQLVAWRFTQNNSAHLFLAFIACGGVLFVFFTTSTWIQLMRVLAKQLGLLSDMVGAEGDEAAVKTAVPEFSTAVRSQLLIGPATYAIEQNPAYRHAFATMEDLQWVSQKEEEAKAALDADEYDALSSAIAAPTPAEEEPFSPPPISSLLPAQPPPLTTTKSGRQRRRTAADKLRAKQRAATAVAAGIALPGALHANKVVPELQSQSPVAGPAPPQRPSGDQVATKQPAQLGMDLQPAAAPSEAVASGSAAAGWQQQQQQQQQQKPPELLSLESLQSQPQVPTPAAAGGGRVRGWGFY